MNFNQLIEMMTPEMYATFQESVAMKRWPDGREMTAEQLENTIQAIIAYQAMHHPSDDPFTINDQGELVMGKGKKYQADENTDEVWTIKSMAKK